MKAIVQDKYGAADVLRLAEVNRPICGGEDVLVRVHAAAVNAGDWHLMRGDPFLARPMFGGFLRPKVKTLGFDVAGRIEAVGEKVTQFQPGDEVFGDISECGFGAFAEYVCVPATALVLKPDMVSFEAAAAVSAAALTALHGLRDCGQLQPQQRVLVMVPLAVSDRLRCKSLERWGLKSQRCAVRLSWTGCDRSIQTTSSTIRKPMPPKPTSPTT